MNSLIEQLSSVLMNQNSVDQISQQVGLNRNQTQNVLGQAIPVILSGLLKNSKQQSGLAGLFGALVKDHDGSILGQLGSLIQNPNSAKGAGMLGHIFGNKNAPLQNQISKSNGIDLQKIAKVFAIAAPIIMGILGKQRQQNDWNMSGLSDALTRTNQDFKQKNEREMGLIERMLDADGDGAISDDIAGMGANILKNWLS